MEPSGLLQLVRGLDGSGEDAIAGKADGHLLVAVERQRGAGIGHAADHQAAVIAMREGDPFGVLRAAGSAR